MSEEPCWPDAGDLVWTDFDPMLGREQAGRRPAVVVSPAEFARNTGFVILCPITRKVRPFSTSVVLSDDSPIQGEVLLSHIRSVDMQARKIRQTGHKIPERSARAVREKLATLITV